MEVWLDCTTNGSDYTNQGGVSAASANNFESKMETSEIITSGLRLFMT